VIYTLLFALVFAPIYVPILLGKLFWFTWMAYTQNVFGASSSNEMILLELRIPKEIQKSPRAMELAITGMHIGISESNFVSRSWFGKQRPSYALEMASIEGRIHFYIYTRRFFKNIVESQLYAQYPEIEVVEAEDYTQGLYYDPKLNNVDGCDFKLSEDDVYPIKTYIDYELDKDPKEEYKIDPMAHLMEYFSGLGPGEQAWLQIYFRTDKSVIPTMQKKEGVSWFEKSPRWKAAIEKEIKNIRDKATPQIAHPQDPDVTSPGYPVLGPSQIEAIKALERSAGKLPFEVGMRGLYVARKDAYRPINWIALFSVMKQFSSENLNGVTAAGGSWLYAFDYPWEDPFGTRQPYRRTELIRAMQLRAWFSTPYVIPGPPFNTPSYTMTAEELATIFHIPSRIIQAPGLTRIPAKKSEAPPNLPI
jgi:hypothetical protein